VNYYLGDIYANPFSVNYTNNRNPIHQYQYGEPYIYYVTQWVKNQYGCKDSITEPLPVKPVFTFFIPNSFSPNGDGVNEYFKGTGIGIDNTTYNMWVYDRWGNELFKSNDLEKGWDGRFKATGDVVMEDVYVWKVNFKDTQGQKHEYRGVVSIIK
jgi:gliding motility-associated-like protein